MLHRGVSQAAILAICGTLGGDALGVAPGLLIGNAMLGINFIGVLLGTPKIWDISDDFRPAPLEVRHGVHYSVVALRIRPFGRSSSVGH